MLRHSTHTAFHTFLRKFYLSFTGRVLSSQTIGVEFASKIIKVGTGPRRKRIKLQLWDTAGTERFRSVSRSYYRGAAGAILVYDVASRSSFDALPTFLNDARALASPNLTLLLAGNKADLLYNPTPNGNVKSQTNFPTSSLSSKPSVRFREDEGDGKFMGSSHTSVGYTSGTQQTATIAPDGIEITSEDASRWASKQSIPVAVETSAFTGDGVEEIFTRLASMILTKIELGEIDPDDPLSGIQYGDSMAWEDGSSIKSGATTFDEAGTPRRKGRNMRARAGTGTWAQGLREWEEVFRLDGLGGRRRGGCC